MIRVEFAGKLVSALNAREHWAAKAKRIKAEREATSWALTAARVDKPALPVVITLTRIAPRALDEHDNLPGAFKPIADSVCAWLGVADNVPGLEFRYGQERAGVRQYGVRIEIEAAA